MQWVLFGTSQIAKERQRSKKPSEPHCLNRTGQTTLEQLIAELGECALLLTNDTGTMHLATLVGVPVVAVFGSTEPRLTGPLGLGHTIIRHQVECSPCFLRECPIDFRCMKAVSVEEVVAAVSAHLEEGQTQLASVQKRADVRRLIRSARPPCGVPAINPLLCWPFGNAPSDAQRERPTHSHRIAGHVF